MNVDNNELNIAVAEGFLIYKETKKLNCFSS